MKDTKKDFIAAILAIVIILLVILIILVSYGIFARDDNNKNDEVDVYSVNSSFDKTDISVMNKIDENKDEVYDEKYEYELNYDGVKFSFNSVMPVINMDNENVKLIKVESAREMQKHIEEHFADCDITIMSAAVSDYRVKEVASQKIKKSDEVMTIELVKNPDILKGLGEKKSDKQYLVGFAAETQNVEEYAKGKLQRKNLDMIVANDVSQAGFNVDTNIAKIITCDGEIKQAPLMQKAELAKLILDTIEEKMNK